MYGIGVAVADYDNDGRDDVYITALDGDRLFHNEGNGKFNDVTKAAGINNASFGTSAAWLDYDKDGKLDLFVGQLRAVDAEGRPLVLARRRQPSPTARRNPTRARRRSSITTSATASSRTSSKKAGIDDPTSKSLGVTVFDYNSDGWPDIFVANDTQPNKLYRNNKNGTFTEEGMSAGVAYSEDGVARGAMGADTADYDRSGRPHLLVGNFSNQMLGLYHNEGTGLFVDEAPKSTVGRASLLSLAFGVFFFDYDLDGYPDILAANGHIEEEIGRVQPKVQFKEPPLLFRNQGQRTFENASSVGGRAVPAPDGGARRGLRGLRSRRRPRRPDHHEPRPGVSVPQRRRQQEQLHLHSYEGREVQSRRHRRGRARRKRRRASSGASSAADRATARRATWR